MCFLFTCVIQEGFSGASHRTSSEIGFGSYINKEVLKGWSEQGAWLGGHRQVTGNGMRSVRGPLLRATALLVSSLCLV